jgi:hypothetical protein
MANEAFAPSQFCFEREDEMGVLERTTCPRSGAGLRPFDQGCYSQCNLEEVLWLYEHVFGGK